MVGDVSMGWLRPPFWQLTGQHLGQQLPHAQAQLGLLQAQQHNYFQLWKTPFAIRTCNHPCRKCMDEWAETDRLEAKKKAAYKARCTAYMAQFRARKQSKWKPAQKNKKENGLLEESD